MELNQEMTLHGIEYIVSLRPKTDGLIVRTEEKYTGNAWKGEFTAKYVEDITQKTGNFKKFEIFYKMLASALRQESPTVYIDVLTAQDLELLKSRKAGSNTSMLSSTSHGSATVPMNSKTPAGGKRYLILTYSGDFDRVHYPLPLSFEEANDPVTLRGTVERLAKELEQLKSFTMMSETGSVACSTPRSAVSAPVDLSEENDRLRKKITLLEKRRIGGAVDMDYMAKEMYEKESDYDKFMREAEKEVQVLRRQVEDSEKQYEETKSELFRTRSKLGAFDTNRSYTEVEALRSQLGDVSSTLEMERKESRAKIDQNKQQLSLTVQEIGRLLDNEKKMKVKVKQLENELEMTLKKVNYNSNSRSGSRSNSVNSQKNTSNRGYSNNSSKGYTNSNTRGYNNFNNRGNNNTNPRGYASGGSAPRSGSVPVKKPTYTPHYTAIRQPPKPVVNPPPRRNPNPIRPSNSPASSIRSNSNERNRLNPYNAGPRRGYSPNNNRTYSPSGAPRSGAAVVRKPGAVERASPLRAANQARPKVPPAAPAPKFHAAPVKKPTPTSTRPGGSVFDRLAHNVTSRPIREAARNPEIKVGPGVTQKAKPIPSAAAIDSKITQANKELESVKISDIDDRLSRLQNLIKNAKG